VQLFYRYDKYPDDKAHSKKANNTSNCSATTRGIASDNSEVTVILFHAFEDLLR
jgi:hypothetical protein